MDYVLELNLSPKQRTKQPDFMNQAETTRITRIKRLHYRSWHRGCKETDVLFGRFADEVLPSLSDAELDDYEALLEAYDSDIWQWYTGKQPLPEEFNTGVWTKLKAINEAAVAGLVESPHRD